MGVVARGAGGAGAVGVSVCAMRVGCKDTLLGSCMVRGAGTFCSDFEKPAQDGGRLLSWLLIHCAPPIRTADGRTYASCRYMAIRMRAEASQGSEGGVARRAATRATPLLRLVAGCSRCVTVGIRLFAVAIYGGNAGEHSNHPGDVIVCAEDCVGNRSPGLYGAHCGGSPTPAVSGAAPTTSLRLSRSQLPWQLRRRQLSLMQ